jgi:hypothetical protein
MKRRAWIPCILALLTASSAWAWDDMKNFKEEFRATYPLTPNGALEVEGFNGSIELLGWDRSEVEVVATKYASTEAILKTLKIEVVNTPNSVAIRVPRPPKEEGGWWAKGGGGVSFVIRTPRKVQLNRLASSNGGIRVESVEGNARLTTSNGGIRLTALRGNLDITTSNGAIELRDVHGNMMVRTSNGGIRAELVDGAFEATTSNGAIRARLGKVPAGTPIRATSSNGTIDLTLDQFGGNEVRASTSNSSIILNLPGSASAQLRAATSNGNVETDFEVSVRGTLSKNRLEGKIGQGGPLIDLSSSNGSIRILRTGRAL